MHRFGKWKNVASVLKYHGKMWYNFAVPHFAVPNFAPAKSPPTFGLPFPALSPCSKRTMFPWGAKGGGGGTPSSEGCQPF